MTAKATQPAVELIRYFITKPCNDAISFYHPQSVDMLTKLQPKTTTATKKRHEIK